MERIVFLIGVLLICGQTALAEYDEAALARELIYLGGHTEAVLTFAGYKPISTTATATTTPEKLAEQLDLAVANSRFAGINFSWAPSHNGFTPEGEIQFYHHGAIRRLLQRPECQSYLSALGINATSSVEDVIATFQKVSKKPDTAKTPAEIAFMGILVGIPPTQVDSFLESRKPGSPLGSNVKFFSWFSAARTIGGFATFPNDKNTEELKAMRSKAQAIWDQFFLDVHSRQKDPLMVIAFFDQQPFRENPMVRLRCAREVAEFLGL